MKDNCNYSNEEICNLYKNARHSTNQLGILQQLTLKSKEEIQEILIDGGVYKIEKRDPVDKEKIIELKNKGLSNAKIAKEIGCSPGYVTICLKKEKDNENEEVKMHNEQKHSDNLTSKECANVSEIKGNINKINDRVQNRNITNNDYVMLAVKTLEILSEIWSKL